MRVTEINWNKTPEDGYVLAYFRQEVIFQKSDPALRQKIEEQQENLMELHVFDSEREYRLMRCETGDFIEAVVSDEAAAEKKEETVKIDGRFEALMPCLRVINYIDYDENGMLSVSNYRFAPAKGGR